MARLTSFTRDGLTFDVADEGPEDGTPVVLLHGFPQRATSWAKVAPLLHAVGYRTYAPDQRGYSPAARPRGRAAYKLEHLVADTEALATAIGAGPVHLVGHDWGAAVAWSFAGAHRDLVRTLTTVSVPHPKAMVRSLRELDQLRRSWYMGFFQLPWVPEKALSNRRNAARFLRGSGMDAETYGRYFAEMVESGALPGGLGWYRAMPLSGPGGLGRRVRVPTTHVWSDGDTALGRRGAELTAEYVVDAPYELVVLEGVSHWIPDQAPQPLAQAILARVGSAGEPSRN